MSVFRRSSWRMLAAIIGPHSDSSKVGSASLCTMVTCWKFISNFRTTPFASANLSTKSPLFHPYYCPPSRDCTQPSVQSWTLTISPTLWTTSLLPLTIFTCRRFSHPLPSQHQPLHVRPVPPTLLGISFNEWRHVMEPFSRRPWIIHLNVKSPMCSCLTSLNAFKTALTHCRTKRMATVAATAPRVKRWPAMVAVDRTLFSFCKKFDFPSSLLSDWTISLPYRWTSATSVVMMATFCPTWSDSAYFSYSALPCSFCSAFGFVAGAIITAIDGIFHKEDSPFSDLQSFFNAKTSIVEIHSSLENTLFLAQWALLMITSRSN